MARLRWRLSKTTFASLCPNGASHTSPGWKPWEFPRKTNPRSEGTPHNLRVSDIDLAPSYAVFLQNTLILWDAVPRAMPWAGRRYPFRVYGTIMFSDTVFDRCGLGATCGNRGHRTRLQRCSFRTHLFFRMRFPGRCPGLVCVAPLGQMGRWRARHHAPVGK